MAKVEKKQKVLFGINIAVCIIIFILALIPYMINNWETVDQVRAAFIVPGVIAIVGGLVFWLISFFKFKVSKSQKIAWILMLVWNIEFLLFTILGGLFLAITISVGSNGLYVAGWVFLLINMIASPILYGMSIYYLNK